MSAVLREHAEQQFAEELHELGRADSRKKIGENYRRSLAVELSSHLHSFEARFPQAPPSLVRRCPLILQKDWNIQRKREFSGHIAGLRGHFALSPVKVIRQTNADGGRIEFN